MSRATRHAPGIRRQPLASHQEISVLDVIFIALTLALFALVGLIAKGVERL